MKKGESHPKPFSCKECGMPITKVRCLSHGMCIRCKMIEYQKHYNEKHPERVKESNRLQSKWYSSMGYSKVGNITSVVVCVQCGRHIKGRYGGLGTRTIRSRALVCPYCRYLYRRGSEIYVIKVRKSGNHGTSMTTFNRWDIYKRIPDVKEFLKSIPEKIETTKELKERVSIEPLARKDFKKFYKMRDKLMERKRKGRG